MSKKRCAECGDASRPRGKRSPYFCAPCDEARIAHLDEQFSALADRFNIPQEDKP